MNDLTLKTIKENMSKIGMENMSIDIYMTLLVEKTYVKVGDKYLTKEDYKKLKANSWEDVDANGIGKDGFDYLMDENDLKQNEVKKQNWEKIMKNNRVTLEEAFEQAILNEKL